MKEIRSAQTLRQNWILGGADRSLDETLACRVVAHKFDERTDVRRHLLYALAVAGRSFKIFHR